MGQFFDTLLDNFQSWASLHTTEDMIWLGIGMFAQLMFSMRFLIQWLVSERHERSVTPVAFWYFSLAGAVMLMIYGIQRGDPVIIFGQSFGFVVYIRNLILIHREKRRERQVADATKSEIEGD